MLGEMGGMGSFTARHMWAPAPPPALDAGGAANKGCFSYGHNWANTSAEEARSYEWIVGNITAHPEISVRYGRATR